MPILSIQQQGGVPVGTRPATWIINTNDTLSTITTAGYLNNALEFGYSFSPNDIVEIITTNQGTVSCIVSVSNGVISLREADNADNVILPTIANAITYFSDAQGTMKCAPSGSPNAIINNGNISAGQNRVAGYFTSYPSGSNSGYLALKAVNNTGGNNGFVIQNSTNSSQNIVATIPDVGSANITFLMTTLSSVDASANLISFDVTANYSSLSGAAQVVLYTASASAQYIIRELYINTGTNFSGGNRSINISDGDTSYSIIPSASLTTLTNSMWGSTALPFPSIAPINQTTSAGVSLFAQYTGGTTDYTAGSFVISGLLQRVA